MMIEVAYGYERKIKVLEVDNKFKTIDTAWDGYYMDLWQELVDELHQIIRSEVECNRYSVYEMNNKKLLYSW